MRTLYVKLVIVVLLTTRLCTAADGPAFEDATQSAGIVWNGTYTFAIAWGDFNNDRMLDLMLSPHGYDPDAGRIPSLYLNNGNSRFDERGQDFFVGLDGLTDSHGIQWADFDNDGDQDLVVVTGADLGRGEGRNLLFENTLGQLLPRTAGACVDDMLGRGRAPTWVDANLDGNLDTALLNARRPDSQAPSLMVLQEAGVTVACAPLVNIDPLAPARAGMIADMDGDELGDLIVLGTYRFPLSAQAGKPSVDRRLDHLFPLIQADVGDTASDFRDHDGARDVAIADLAGDLRREVVITRAFHRDVAPSYAVQPDAQSLLLGLNPVDSDTGASFRSSGILTAEFGLRPKLDFSRDLVTCGRSMKIIAGLQFQLDPDDPDCQGQPTPSTNTRRHLAIGYDAITSRWTIRYADKVDLPLQLRLNSENPIEDISAIGALIIDPDSSSVAVNHTVWQYDEIESAYVEVVADGLTSRPTLSRSIATGDFDNDMDVDIVTARSTSLRTTGISIWENLGDGRFQERFLADPSPDPPHDLEYGIGTKIAVADYDLDGFLDVFSSATAWKGAVNTFAGSPPRLLRNLGGGGHWIELDLIGRYSTRDGVGAVVYANAGGTTQVRDSGAENHLFAQGARRIHFGLGENALLDSLEVYWPSGLWQRHESLAVDQLLEVSEGMGTAGDDQITGTDAAEDIDVGGGDDVVRASAGDDVLRGRGGHDVLYGQSGDDILHGHGGADRLYGGGGADVIRAGPGDDLIMGGPGHDRTWGGSGADRFVYRPGHSPAVDGEEDTIQDFDALAGDLVDLRPLGPLEFIGDAPFSGAGTSQVRAFRSVCCDTTLIEADTDGDAVADSRVVLSGKRSIDRQALLLR